MGCVDRHRLRATGPRIGKPRRVPSPSRGRGRGVRRPAPAARQVGPHYSARSPDRRRIKQVCCTSCEAPPVALLRGSTRRTQRHASRWRPIAADTTPGRGSRRVTRRATYAPQAVVGKRCMSVGEPLPRRRRRSRPPLLRCTTSAFGRSGLENQAEETEGRARRGRAGGRV